MALQTSKQLLQKAQKNNYAVPAFNVENMEMAMAVIETANELKSPVILQTTSSTVKYADMQVYKAMVEALAKSVDIPVVLHLDHGSSVELAEKAMKDGYTSVMIDGSQMDFEANIAITQQVVRMGAANNIPIEAELGKVGGKEDDLEVKEADANTNPQEAVEFVNRTGIDSFAIAIGTSHGLYNGTPRIDIERLKEIRALIDIPLVLHGTTGIDGEIVKQCIAAGMCKVNYATELRIAYSDGVRDCLSMDENIFDPKVYGKAGMDKVKVVVKKNIELCGSGGKA